MASIGVASSIMSSEGFDIIKTARFAHENGFSHVQPYLNPACKDPRYLSTFIQAVKDTNLGVIIHLPDMPMAKEYIEQASTIALALTTQDVRTLIHYHDTISNSSVPLISGMRVGIENGLNGGLIGSDITRALDLSRVANSFFVFDPGRIMYARDSIERDAAKDFILKIIRSMDPKRDILHLADKKYWDRPFRECQEVFGLGISEFMFMETLTFLNAGGLIIFEHEDPLLALDSKELLEKFAGQEFISD